MSLYVKWVNQIKTEATSAWLTEGQKAAFESIVTKWHSHPFVCLCGPSGCGKSFVARLLHREKGYHYTQDLSSVVEDAGDVVLDGGVYSRPLRSLAASLRLRRVVVVTRQLPKDPMPRAQIVLGEADIRQFQHNLFKNRVIESFLTSEHSTDLGRILQLEAIERIG